MINSNSSKDQVKWHALILLAVLVICYGPMFLNYYYLDDTSTVYAGYLLKTDFSKLFTHIFDYIYVGRPYRYLVAVTYWLNYLISGALPWSYYLFSFLLHLGASWLTYLIVRRTSGNSQRAFLASILFAVSLNKVDAVAWIAARTTLQGAFFVICSIWCYFNFMDKKQSVGWGLAVLTTFYCAWGSYEIGLLLPVMYLLVAVVFYSKEDILSKRNIIICSLAFATLAAVVIWARFWSMSTDGSVIKETMIIPKLFHVLRNITSIPLSFIVHPSILQNPAELYHNASTNWGIIEVLGLLMLSVPLLLTKKLKEKELIFGIAFFIIASILITVPRWGYYPTFWLNERLGDIRWSLGRYSYLGSFGLYIVASVLLQRSYQFILNKLPAYNFVVKLTAVAFLIVFVSYNVYWIYSREAMWRELSSHIQTEVQAVKQLNLNVSSDIRVYHFNFLLYGKHTQSMLRVLFQQPYLAVANGKDFGTDGYHGPYLLLSTDGETAQYLFGQQ